MTKLAFFDIDGVLSAPRYKNEQGDMVIGFSVDGWLKHCSTAKEDGYEDCLPVPGVREFAEELAANGCRLFVLSALMSAPEEGAKRKFVEKHYTGLFEKMFFVNSDIEKIHVIESMSEQEEICISECMLVEDTFPTCLMAHENGIQAVHISNVIAGNISG